MWYLIYIDADFFLEISFNNLVIIIILKKIINIKHINERDIILSLIKISNTFLIR